MPFISDILQIPELQFLKFLRLIYFIDCKESFETLVFLVVNFNQILEFLITKLTNFKVRQSTWYVYPRIFIVFCIYLNTFPNLFLMIRYRVVQDFVTADDTISNKVDELAYDYSNVLLAYTDMIYFIVVTITSTGYGDILAKNMPEYLITVVVIISGMYVHGYAIAKIKMAVNVISEIKDHQREMLDAMDTMIVNMEIQRRRTYNKEVINPYAPFVPVLWHCKEAHLLSIKNDVIPLFRSVFFEKLSDIDKNLIFESYLEGLKHKFSGIFKIFAEVIGYELFISMKMKV